MWKSIDVSLFFSVNCYLNGYLGTIPFLSAVELVSILIDLLTHFVFDFFSCWNISYVRT